MTEMFDDTVAVVENRPLTGGHFLLSLLAPRQARATRPGQFAMVRLLGRSDVLLRRPMSIFDVVPAHEVDPPVRVRRYSDGQRPSRQRNSPEIIQLLYKIVGRGTRLMAELKPGHKVGLLAPLGHGFFAEEYLPRAKNADQVLHVAGGIGIAALLLPAREIAAAGVSQRLFFGGRTKDDLVGTEKFKPLVKQIVLATENGSKGHRGFVTQPLEAFLKKDRSKKYLIMVCGPWAMLDSTVRLAEQFGHLCLLSMENRMGCGLGVCLGCCIRVEGTGHAAYQRVCTEGPVFWAEKVIWQKEEALKA